MLFVVADQFSRCSTLLNDVQKANYSQRMDIYTWLR